MVAGRDFQQHVFVRQAFGGCSPDSRVRVLARERAQRGFIVDAAYGGRTNAFLAVPQRDGHERPFVVQAPNRDFAHHRVASFRCDTRERGVVAQASHGMLRNDGIVCVESHLEEGVFTVQSCERRLRGCSQSGVNRNAHELALRGESGDRRACGVRITKPANVDGALAEAGL